ncbi:MAG: aminoacyl-tRNA hydrolase [Spirochaetes bacterium]|nr:aminoacyl-tRNA hydrolase [Spirochaetota bacterium]
MKLIVGFGNPGDRFANNRQNIGFKVIDIIGNNENIEVKIKKKKSIIGRGKIMGTEVVLLKPQTFVNLIGESVLYIASFLRINVRDIICIVEDSSLEVGEMRVDYVMTGIVHPGIESMTRALKSDRYAKIRVGIGRPKKGVDMAAYLLEDFTTDENLVLIDVLNKTEEVVKMLIKHPIEEVQERYNPEGAFRIKRRKVKKVHIDHRKAR